MQAVWRLGESSVRSVQEGLGNDLAYTTLMTTLDRLFRKGLLQRRKVGKAFLYTASVTPDELRGGAARNLIDVLLGRSGERAAPVLSCIVDAVGERDRALLDELGSLIRQKQRELRD